MQNISTMKNSMKQAFEASEKKEEESRVELRSVEEGDETSRLSEAWKDNHIENPSTPNTDLFSPYNTGHFSLNPSAGKQHVNGGKFFSTLSQFRT